jgi:hypothetical protein
VPICHEKQFIFFHIPRCGGTSLESFFRLQTVDQLFGVVRAGDRILTLHHMPPRDLLAARLIDNDTMRSYFKFTVIRDPFDRMASDYLWQRKHDRHGEFAHLTFMDYLSKAERVVQERRYYAKRHYDHFRPMLDYCVSGGEVLVDKILLLDELDGELSMLEDRLGRVRLPHLNRHGDYSELRTTRHMDRVYQIYECDKALFENVGALMSHV